jgi:hypothetical protein
MTEPRFHDVRQALGVGKPNLLTTGPAIPGRPVAARAARG